MEYLGEALTLGFDSLIFGICLKQYFHYRNSMKAVKNAEIYDIGENLKLIINDRPEKKIEYVALRGTVGALGKPLYGVHDKSISGVVQKLSVKEHVVARTTAGFWSDQERTMQEIYNTVPFALRQGKHSVEILEPLSAEILDMDVISDEFKPSAPTITDHIWGFFTGVRQRGLQSTEEMLREGVTITALGEISSSPESPEKLILQPPLNTPFYLTTMSVSSLLRKLDERRRIYRYLCLMFGAIGLVIGGIVVRRYWKDREEQRLSEQLRRSLAESRKERRQRVREKDLREDQICVVCRTNPREIILLPCGHVCLCEDCSDGIDTDCPVCRGPIELKNAAYIV
ncbi:mitochondrial ubiquitin ligase activator of nfkb 1 [Fopius arisanus]|uniref:RING-type E3 ubiquitin transferase n=2 Tax=Fopius arisanus TaxID=64838 RepID=A0A9R1TN75_9HYME|nr:PREDICTED: mitochondrial ubiquitin ligase activator of nfkb 1 [Fopius arisanus]XP_011312014.1 PREDICTED: mitochondrial ubiquitin ligase activator of nfkb 1 [Fopius arisanus]